MGTVLQAVPVPFIQNQQNPPKLVKLIHVHNLGFVLK